ncbi:hypothetical protein [Luteolibacter luteus]|uniref:Uncharacterized protein n=1 Tax=Luteolibacter luteus TaxID=2728835 RepID=A0A858RDS6_9BACT|nr:hypothetical protein [Luteolibacter luteus]QJE95236.1 hypothetical protein HHL09_05420 [Luteolibacter luteus]
MIPAPSKRPFNFPTPAEALGFFCHPTLSPFTRPFVHNGTLCAANGYAAIRLDRFNGDAGALEDAPFAFLQRFYTLPWDRFEEDGREWRDIDLSRGTIYRGDLLPLWIPDGKGHAFTQDKLVLTAGGPLVPLALLQLLARLPRPELRMCSTYFASPLLVRFKGGEAIVAPRFPDPVRAKVEIAFHLFKPKSGPLLPGGLI